ncbi:MAG: transcription termination/antitermination protein NusG [Candidatus Gracilibacteria bacterium]|nr:transcription termination/antitermination protein NusG [Candidatus Gracilibacteria bacterium]
MAKQDLSAGRNWYAVHTYSGYEDTVKQAIEQRIESMNMQDHVFEVVVPKEKVAVIKNGKRVIVEKNLFSGYVLVDMIVTDASWFMIRNTPNVTGFVGSGNIPVPVLPEEFGIIKKRMGEATPTTDIKLLVNDLVKIKEGPFANYEGVISEVNKAKGKVTVMVSIFDRETPVELDFDQVIKKI